MGLKYYDVNYSLEVSLYCTNRKVIKLRTDRHTASKPSWGKYGLRSNHKVFNLRRLLAYDDDAQSSGVVVFSQTTDRYFKQAKKERWKTKRA